VTKLATRPLWAEFRPWQTNAALALIGLAMIGFTRQLIVEYDPEYHYMIGFDGVACAQLVLFAAAVLILALRSSNVNRFTFPIILTVAILCRMVALFPEPVLSSDVYRYAWDGVVQHAHINPYRYVPGDPALTFLRAPNQDLFDNMNRRDYARTIYPPAAQVLFFLITFISPLVTGMKAAIIAFEGLTLLGLIKLLQHLHIRREWSILYAWFPLLIWEFGGSGHLDAVVICFMVLAMLFRYRRQPILTGLFLGLAVLTKFYPLVLLPAFYQRQPDGRLDWKMPATMVALAAVFYAPYLSAGKYVFGFLGGYVQEEGMANGTRYFLLDIFQMLPGMQSVPNIAYLAFVAAVFVALTIWAWRVASPPDSPRDAFLAPALGLALALMLLFSPHYPWYVAWLVPFLVLRPSLTVFTYVAGMFYLCTTALATGYGPKQFLLNEILYGTVALGIIIEITLRRLPLTRHWFGSIAKESTAPRYS
jgi:alpha-1,6-mannosyltransferase